jgi:hypothetical protein
MIPTSIKNAMTIGAALESDIGAGFLVLVDVLVAVELVVAVLNEDVTASPWAPRLVAVMAAPDGVPDGEHPEVHAHPR